MGSFNRLDRGEDYVDQARVDEHLDGVRWEGESDTLSGISYELQMGQDGTMAATASIAITVSGIGDL